ncbi:hypothetical protein ACLMJK_003097 [Lecanora helva]
MAQRRNNRGGRGRRDDNWPYDDTRKLNTVYRSSTGAKLRVDNLHYDLSEEDLEDLFTRIAPITSLSLRYDRSGRSTGTAFVTYPSVSSANRAIREFDGANAAGQPIRLALLPTGPSGDLIRGRGGGAARNPFDTAVKPGRSLFDRVEAPYRRSRSRSPGAPRRTNTEKPPPEGVDRYIPSPGGSRFRRSRTRSPRRKSPISRTRSPYRGRRRGGRDDRDGGPRMVNGRPRKTQDELDQEMEDYWNKKGEANGNETVNNESGVTGNSEAVAPAAAPIDEDIDMIE